MKCLLSQPGRLTYVGQASRLSFIDERSRGFASPLIVILIVISGRTSCLSILDHDWETRRESGRLEERMV